MSGAKSESRSFGNDNINQGFGGRDVRRGPSVGRPFVLLLHYYYNLLDASFRFIASYSLLTICFLAFLLV